MEIVDRSTDRPVTDPAQALQKKGAAAAARTPGPVSTLDSTRARVSRGLAPVLDGPCATTTTRKTKAAKMQTQTQTQMQTDADRAATHLSSISHSTLPACLPTKYADPRRPARTPHPAPIDPARLNPTHGRGRQSKRRENNNNNNHQKAQENQPLLARARASLSSARGLRFGEMPSGVRRSSIAPRPLTAT